MLNTRPLTRRCFLTRLQKEEHFSEVTLSSLWHICIRNNYDITACSRFNIWIFASTLYFYVCCTTATSFIYISICDPSVVPGSQWFIWQISHLVLGQFKRFLQNASQNESKQKSATVKLNRKWKVHTNQCRHDHVKLEIWNSKKTRCKAENHNGLNAGDWERGHKWYKWVRFSFFFLCYESYWQTCFLHKDERKTWEIICL